jgi:hypothetical protein
MTNAPLLPVDRLIATLNIVARESAHLAWSRLRLFSQPIDTSPGFWL